MSTIEEFELREKAAQCFRLAKLNTDPALLKDLTQLGQEYLDQADALTQKQVD